ncbi:MAG: 3-phosphoglycerate dehydrogenase, partial [Firmicutes bacterium]|nr:3-phosphoglycerate dehydrogenase [Bacillota bacterium]
MPNILKLNKISPLAEKILPAGYKLSDACENPDAIIVRSFEMKDYALPDSLLMVARAGAGTNNIPVPRCSEKGIVVFNTPGANANAVKELVICGMFMCGRKIVDGINWAQSLKDQDEVGKKIEDGKKAFIGGEIMGKTLGIFGMGAIGMLVAQAAIALGMNVLGFDTSMPEKIETLVPRIKMVKDPSEI